MKATIEVFREEIRKLVEQFERDKHFYLKKHYLEAQARQDFINPFFEALGWNLGIEEGISPFEREVLLEKGETKGRPDYNFRIEGASKFYVEAKAPSEPLDKTAHIMQAKSYAWNTKDVFIVVLTDFEEFKVFDASLKPDPRNPNLGLIYDFKYTDYLEKLDKLWVLSRDEVASGSLDKLLLKDAQSKRLRIPVDKSFLSDMTGWREELAKDLYKRNTDIDVRMLNEVVQRILDRFVFIRTAEDRKIIEPKSLLELVELWKSEGKRRPLQYHLNILFRQINGDLNGEIFKHHACETYEFDSSLLAKIIERLYFPNCPYRFDVIGVELLGSIYERYLGNTIRLTAKRVKVEEKPDVRKAGGVYYTPKYIVDYIVDNTVGKLIEGKTPEEIAEIKILDPACGSGSFLLGAYQKLIDYHIKYYTEHPAEAGRSTLFPDLIIDLEGSHRLSITKKAEILQNNIYGVDIDPQAVEVSMMSLYIKALEGERTLPQNKELLPSLANNVKCGNSLIGYDIFEQQTLIEDEERERINPFDWNSRKAGFGDIMGKGGFDCVIGNPPYVRLHNIDKKALKYFFGNYQTAEKKCDIYAFFTERVLKTLLRKKGVLGYIISNTWLNLDSFTKLRQIVTEENRLIRIVTLNNPFYKVSVTPIMFFVEKNNLKEYKFFVAHLDLTTQDTIDEKEISSQTLSPPAYIIDLTTTEESLRLVNKIDQQSIPLGNGNIAKIQYGIMTADNKKFIVTEPKTKYHKRLLAGEDIRRYHIKWPGNRYVDYRPKEMKKKKTARPGEPERFEQEQKIVFQRYSSTKLIAALDTSQFYTLGTTIIGYSVSQYSNKYLLGLINSSLLSWWYGRAFTSPTNYIREFEILPIHTIDFNNSKDKEVHDKLIALVDHMLELNSKKNALPPSSERERIEREIAVTDEKIDEIVYGLYGLTEEEIRVVESE